MGYHKNDISSLNIEKFLYLLKNFHLHFKKKNVVLNSNQAF